MKTPHYLKALKKSLLDLHLLNKELVQYGIDVHYIQRLGWRAFKIGGTIGDCQTQICWMGQGTVLEWFNDPHGKAKEFISTFE